MDLFKWKKNLKPKFPNLVERFLGNKIDEHASSAEEIATIPSVNIADKNNAFEVSVAVPGLEKNDIKLEIQDQCLVISSEKQYTNEEKEGRWMRREFGYASFQRMFQLPEDADPERIDASMKNGMLTVKVGKRKGAEAKTKVIEVK